MDAALSSLIRRSAGSLLEDEEAFAAIERQIIAGLPTPVRADPGFLRVVSLSTRSNCVHWARALVRDPLGPTPPNASSDVLDIAVDVFRRGLEHASYDAYRTGQHLLWRAWTAAVFRTVSEDGVADVARTVGAVLDATSGTLHAYISATQDRLLEQVERLRAEIGNSSDSDRFRTVMLVLDGEPISDDRAGALLRYGLGRDHAAAIVWNEAPSQSSDGDLERTVDRVLRQSGTRQICLIWASAHVLWVWWNDANRQTVGHVKEKLSELRVPGMRIAIGDTGRGRDGFRRTHQHARDVQRLMVREGRSTVVAYADVDAVTLAARDAAEAEAFLDRTLGALREAPVELRETMRVYQRFQCSPARTARELHTHRNTVISRVERASKLLPDGVLDHPLELELALAMDAWLRRS
jgi:DNA-binding PucR family transcriptional regulator